MNPTRPAWRVVFSFLGLASWSCPVSCFVCPSCHSTCLEPGLILFVPERLARYTCNWKNRIYLGDSSSLLSVVYRGSFATIFPFFGLRYALWCRYCFLIRNGRGFATKLQTWSSVELYWFGYKPVLSRLAISSATDKAWNTGTTLYPRILGYNLTSGIVHNLEARCRPKQHCGGLETVSFGFFWRMSGVREIPLIS